MRPSVLTTATINEKHRPSQVRHIELPTGLLTVDVENSDLPLDSMCGFAARRNPKRGFLFVSKVLGKHIAVKPSVMRQVYARLAAKIDRNLPGPVVFIGMAETAICLGQGVHEEYCRMTGRDDVLFMHSTRYKLSAAETLEFKEEHCHAADQIIYLPRGREQLALFKGARSLVMVDDEGSTGTTFVNLCRAMRHYCHDIEQVATVVLTDWRSQSARLSNAEGFSQLSVDHRAISLLSGTYMFTPDPMMAKLPMPNSSGNGQLKDALIGCDFGRFGLTAKDYGPSAPLQRTIARAVACMSLDGSKERQERSLILGTGEFAYAPFRAAEELELRGYDVFVQSTTRSPIMVHGAIESALSFADNYDDGIANYLYNVSPGQYDNVVVCTETPLWSLDRGLTEQLGAHLVRMG